MRQSSTTLPPLTEVQNEINRRKFAKRGGLIRFIRHFWHVLEPVEPFVDGWCIDGMCDHLEAVSYGEITRLLLNVPPGFMKSMLLNVWWPAWEWGALNRPDLRYVAFSYSSILTERDNEKFGYLISSPEYQALYGNRVVITKEGVGRIANTARGWKFASSIGGVGTGERGHRVLSDDLHKVSEAESETVREDVTRWFRESMQNRLNDLKRDAIIVLGQRVHSADVSGVIIREYPDYVHYCVPMEYDGRDWNRETGRKYQTVIGWSDPREEMGELAWPERYPIEVLEPFKSRSYLWNGQYQQSPSARGGSIILESYWKTWDREAQIANDVKLGAYPSFDYIVAYFDGALGQKLENDWSALTVWGTWVETDAFQRAGELFGTPSVMIISAWRKRLTLHGKTDLPQMRGESKEDYLIRVKSNWGLVEWIADTCKKFNVDKLLIEAKANGHDIANEMQRLYARENWMVVLDDPGRYDKTARVYAQQHLFADGRIWAPDTEWADEVIDEFAQFPRGAHDDYVDSGIGALRHLRKMGLLVRADENSSAVEELQFPPTPPKKIRYEA